MTQFAQADEPAQAKKTLELKTKREKLAVAPPASSISDRPQKLAAKERPEATAERVKRWRDRFDAGADSPESVRQVVDELIVSRQYNEVIACLEQAIIHAKIQPWMYEVLAISMEAAGRPNAQIERVMLSSQDFVSNDASSMMMLAAYLTRFERHERALELYRQAAHLEPHRPEPFLQALAIARRTRNAEAVVWSAPEVLAYAWGSDRAPLRRDAEQAASDAVQQLMKAGKLSKAIELQEGMRNARELDLAVRLDWNGQGDLDLLVTEPTGTVCSMDKPYTSGGGIFIHDGFGPNQSRCYDEYVCPRAISGEYVLRVRHVWGDIVGKRARLTIIRGKDTPQEQTETQTVILGRVDQLVRISVTQGRRNDADAKVPDPATKQTGRRGTARSAVLAQVGNNGGGQIGGGQGTGGGGGGSVGYQPVVAFINEGVTLNALATVSGDRRYVRINAAPVFSSITDVFTFSFISSGGGGGGGTGGAGR